MKNEMILAGVGSLTPFGRGTKAAWDKIIRGESGFGPYRRPFGANGEHRLCGLIPDGMIDALLPSRKFQRLPRYSKLVLAAAAECLKDAGIGHLKSAVQPSRIGVFLGTSRGPQEAVESISLKLVEGFAQQINPLHFQETVYNAPLGHLSIHYGITGMCIAFSSGIASGFQALDTAVAYLDDGMIDLALVGGVDTVTEIYLRGLSDVRALSPRDGGQEEVAPFSARRNGTIVGEGGVFLALEREQSNVRRSGARHSRIKSTAIAGDGFSHYGNDPAGKGFDLAMRACLREAGCQTRDIDLILACASGQPALDGSEWRGIASVWGSEVGRVPVTSIKGVSGDLGAATQLLSLAVCRHIFESGLIPGTLHSEPMEPECPLRVVHEPVHESAATALLNEASWGGINASVLVRTI